ncbi:TolC family protein [Lacibacter luteus]|uniref:TolC family protein n=1 Tax=Lacibacter luteus TaxID=2508719 RepID=A0A4Q1CI08_9BACT|nr:TolC family protein [Lacibacter luteus]RXK59735.1 TolC family protein [Lacibacter luteus]
MKKTLLTILSSIFLLTGTRLLAQEKWDLVRCVDYAIANNISVRQADVQARISNLTYEQNKLSRYPNANFSTSTGTNFGRAVNPTTNLFETTTLLFQNYGLNANVLLYNWNSVKNGILSAKYNLEASKASVESAKNDIALSVATTFLQALLAKEQARIAQVQMQQTRARLVDTRKRVDAGSLPELNALELESQYAADSATYINASTTAQQTLLTLKATLNLDAAQPFDISEPPVSLIPVESIGDLQPDVVYNLALQTQPKQKVNDLRIKGIEANIKSVRGQLYPSISAFGGLSTRFGSSNVNTIILPGTYGTQPLGPRVNVNGTNYPVEFYGYDVIQSKKNLGQMWTGWGNQLNENFSQNIGIQISVPIFNGASVRTNYNRSKLDLVNAKLVKEQADMQLKNDIYQAYNAAVNALQRYNASKKTLEVSERASVLAQKRYEAGLLQTIELITNQNNLFRARIQNLADQFDYVFRMKVLEFYKGQGLKL